MCLTINAIDCWPVILQDFDSCSHEVGPMLTGIAQYFTNLFTKHGKHIITGYKSRLSSFCSYHNHL